MCCVIDGCICFSECSRHATRRTIIVQNNSPSVSSPWGGGQLRVQLAKRYSLARVHPAIVLRRVVELVALQRTVGCSAGWERIISSKHDEGLAIGGRSEAEANRAGGIGRGAGLGAAD